MEERLYNDEARGPRCESGDRVRQKDLAVRGGGREEPAGRRKSVYATGCEPGALYDSSLGQRRIGGADLGARLRDREAGDRFQDEKCDDDGGAEEQEFGRGQ